MRVTWCRRNPAGGPVRCVSDSVSSCFSNRTCSSLVFTIFLPDTNVTKCPHTCCRHRPLPSNTLPRRLKLSSYPQSFRHRVRRFEMICYVKKKEHPNIHSKTSNLKCRYFSLFFARMLSRGRFCWAPHPIDSTSRWDPNQSAMGWFVVWGNKPSWSNSFKHMDVLVWIAHNENLVRTSWLWAGQKDDV